MKPLKATFPPTQLLSVHRQGRTVSAPYFDALAPLLPFKPHHISMARMVFVEGKTQKEAAEQFACTQQSTQRPIRAIWNFLELFESLVEARESALNAPLPDGMTRVSYVLPSELAARFSERVALLDLPAPKYDLKA